MVFLVSLLFISTSAYAAGPQCTHAPIRELAVRSCKATLAALGCVEAAAIDPGLAKSLRDCDKEPEIDLNFAKGVAVGGFHSVVDLAKTLAKPITIYADVYTALKDTDDGRNRATDACMKTLECRTATQHDAGSGTWDKIPPQNLTQPQMKELWIRAEMMNAAKIKDIKWRGLRERLELAKKGVDPESKEMDAALTARDPEYMQIIRSEDRFNANQPTLGAIVQSVYQHALCLNNEMSGEMAGYAVATFIDPVAAYGLLARLPRVAALIKAAVRVDKAANDARLLSLERRGAERRFGTRGGRRATDEITDPAKKLFTRQNLNTKLMTAEENAAFIQEARKLEPEGNTIYVKREFGDLKTVNDAGDKDFATSLGSKDKRIFLKKMTALEKRFPDFKITYGYDEFKSLTLQVKFTGKVRPADLGARLNEVEKEANELLNAETAGVYKVSDHAPDLHFRTATGDTYGRASVTARVARRLPKDRVYDYHDPLVQSYLRRELRKSKAVFEKMQTGAFDSKILTGPRGALVPNEEVMAIVRKNISNPDTVAKLVKKEFKLGSFTREQAQDLIQIAESTDAFSASPMTAVREIIQYGDAAHGGMSVDFANLGARNMQATVEHVVGATSVDQAVKNGQIAEQAVTAQFKEQQAAMGKLLGDTGRFSGDDAGAVFKTPRSLVEKQTLVQAMAANPQTRNVRAAFFPAGVSDVAQRTTLLTHGELIEKDLRAVLKDVIPKERLQSMTFGIDMRTTVANQGTVGVLTGVAGAPLTASERVSIAKALKEAVATRSARLTEASNGATQVRYRAVAD